MERIYKCKDFTLKSFRQGSRIQGKPEYAYTAIYHYKDGRTYQLRNIFYTKKSARQYISKLVKELNGTINNHMNNKK